MSACRGGGKAMCLSTRRRPGNLPAGFSGVGTWDAPRRRPGSSFRSGPRLSPGSKNKKGELLLPHHLGLRILAGQGEGVAVGDAQHLLVLRILHLDPVVE